MDGGDGVIDGKEHRPDDFGRIVEWEVEKSEYARQRQLQIAVEGVGKGRDPVFQLFEVGRDQFRLCIAVIQQRQRSLGFVQKEIGGIHILVGQRKRMQLVRGSLKCFVNFACDGGRRV